MTTKHLVIFGAGVLAGYLLVDYLRKNEMGTSQLGVPPTAIDPKVAECEGMFQQHLQTLRMPPENLEAYKKQYMSDCVSGTGIFSPTPPPPPPLDAFMSDTVNTVNS